jgi:hypothetical protein
VYESVPVNGWRIVLPLTVAGPVLITPVHLSKAAMDSAGGRMTPPMLVMVTGIAPGNAAVFVVIVVVLPDAVAVLKSAGFVCPYWRIVTALLEVAIASEASDARARTLMEASLMGPLLRCCGMRMMLRFVVVGSSYRDRLQSCNQYAGNLPGLRLAMCGGLS